MDSELMIVPAYAYAYTPLPYPTPTLPYTPTTPTPYPSPLTSSLVSSILFLIAAANFDHTSIEPFIFIIT